MVNVCIECGMDKRDDDYNRCYECNEKIGSHSCVKCGNECSASHETCFFCYGKTLAPCSLCGKNCNKKFQICWDCREQKKEKEEKKPIKKPVKKSVKH